MFMSPFQYEVCFFNIFSQYSLICLIRVHISNISKRLNNLNAKPWSVGVYFPGADLAKAKAWTALAFSSNQNALTSRAVGQLAEDKSQPFWNIENSNQPAADDPTDPRGIQLQPGGIPLYNQQKQLIGAIGVSGDGTEQDEAVALACSSGFEAPQNIRGGNPYVDVTNPLSLLSAWCEFKRKMQVAGRSKVKFDQLYRRDSNQIACEVRETLNRELCESKKDVCLAVSNSHIKTPES